jgi:hypothetical protein
VVIPPVVAAPPAPVVPATVLEPDVVVPLPVAVVVLPVPVPEVPVVPVAPLVWPVVPLPLLLPDGRFPEPPSSEHAAAMPAASTKVQPRARKMEGVFDMAAA